MARFDDAIRWIVANDDTSGITEDSETETLPVTAALVADLFFKTDEQVHRSILKEKQRVERINGRQSE